MKNIEVSSLGKLWILDLDGTIVKHNGYKIDGYDTFLEGAYDFLNSIGKNDMIIFITSRTEEFRQMTCDFLRSNHIRYDQIIFNVPYGERILINDKKVSGLETAIAVNTDRDRFMDINFTINQDL